MKKYFNLSVYILILLFNISAPSFVKAQPKPVMNSGELKLALEKLNVLGSVLYIAAHPDDENNALLAYFAQGKLLRTGYMSLTRGDGGQNLLGTEQGDLLGVLRTQELLQARKIDGAEQYFSRAVDFGFSKSATETLDFWGKEKILSDVVWVIRKFRPDVIITRFQGTKADGHGNHTASEMLAAEAFKLSGDSTKFPEQLKYVKPWQAKRILWNAWLPILEKRKTDLSKLLKVDVGGYNSLLGKSYTEIAAESRSMHKSQGFGSSSSFGETINYFVPVAGSPAEKNIFEGIDMTWKRINGGEIIDKLITEANGKFNPDNPSAIIPTLLRAYSAMNEIKNNYWVKQKKKELLEVIRSCAGIFIEADASDYTVSPGDEIKITSSIINRSNFPFKLGKVEVTDQEREITENIDLKNEKLFSVNLTSKIPDDTDYSQPYWLKEEHSLGDYVVTDQRLIGKPENDPALTVKFFVKYGNEQLIFSTPVFYKWTDPVKGEEFRPLVIAPKVIINLKDKVYLFPNSDERKVSFTIKSGEDNLAGILRINIPQGWKVEPAKQSFLLKKKYDEQILNFQVTPPNKFSEGYITAEATIGGKDISFGESIINYSHIPVQTVFYPSKAKIIRLDLKKVVNNIGYIMGPGDEVPPILQELGYNVTMLTDNDIETKNLASFDAIITGIRLYNTDKQISFEQPKLLQYVKNGGTLVVQYNKFFDLVTDKIGPYPFHISNDRVTDENSKVTFLDRNNPILNYPNKITEDNFNGWIQERGLYFADKWDKNYEAVISCHDPDETPKDGGLLFTHYGKGVFIYTGYDWFRELPGGVSGSYPIFVNMISAGKYYQTLQSK
ncbi:MAG: PIG-L family deacetylase [Ignavibacteriaceae bacterium]